MSEHMTATDPGLLSPLEHDAIAITAELWAMLCAITSDGAARDGDLRELIFHIHGIQRAVLKQAAARAYPELYRLLGGDPPPSDLLYHGHADDLLEHDGEPS